MSAQPGDAIGGRSITIVGAGRMGTALAAALQARGTAVHGPLGRNDPVTGDIVLLVVPDPAIGGAARSVPEGSLVGHTAGALTLEVFGARECFSLHPLMTAGDGRADFAGASAAIAGSSGRALEVARSLATRLGMIPVEIPDDKRVAYHAAASIAANFLVTLETMAARVGAGSGLERKHLMPLARAALENWGRLGTAALTGPIARGDAATVARHRAEIAKVAPEFLAAWESLVKATEAIAHEDAPRSPTPDIPAHQSSK
jgi:predicted short-subunit dehydrogenase-like oxidoreductase (DUF2520 family)